MHNVIINYYSTKVNLPIIPHKLKENGANPSDLIDISGCFFDWRKK
jgi:hypothetical protein